MSEITSSGAGLRRNVPLIGAIGISIALMAPSMAASLTPQATGSIVGRAIPLAFVLATVGVLLIAYGFVRLSQHFHHAGSSYGFVGAMLGARAGAIAGWGLFGTYALFAAETTIACGIFIAAFLQQIGLWGTTGTIVPFLFAIIPLVAVWLVASREIKNATRVLLVAEGATVAFIVVVLLVVLIKVLAGSAPGGHSFTFSAFSPEHGQGFGTIFKGAIFGFLAFAGFEAAATLGEETRNPRRDIPRAILGTAIVGGIFFVVVTLIEVNGFGTGTQGLAAFVGSASLLGDLGQQYVAHWVGDIVTLGTAVSAFACALASTVGATRLLFSFSRDGLGPAQAGEASKQTGAPVFALSIVVTLITVTLLGFAIDDVQPFDVFAWLGTIGVLILLVSYGLTAIAALKLVFAGVGRRIPKWQAIFPLAALVVIGFTYRYNVDLNSTGSVLWNPLVAFIWIVLGLVIVLGFPAVARRVGRGLAESDGLHVTDSTGDEQTSDPSAGSLVAR